MVKSGHINRRRMMAASGAAVAALPLTMRAGEEYPWVGRFPIGADGGLKILAITDLHFGNAGRAVDEWTIHDIRRMIAKHKPELIIVTGDAWFSLTGKQGEERCRFFCDTMSSFGLPWAYVRGNHDLALDFTKCDEMLTNAKGSLYLGSGTEGHYRVTVMDGDAPRWNFIFINDAAPKLGFDNRQRKWLLAEADRIKAEQAAPAPAILFAHIPLVAYREMALAGEAIGIQREPVFCETCKTRAMDGVVETGIVKAMYCGHDHCNNFQGEWRGVHLEYLRSTGWAGYGAERVVKGGTILNLGPDGERETTTVFPSGRTWKARKKVNPWLNEQETYRTPSFAEKEEDEEQ